MQLQPQRSQLAPSIRPLPHHLLLALVQMSQLQQYHLQLARLQPHHLQLQ